MSVAKIIVLPLVLVGVAVLAFIIGYVAFGQGRYFDSSNDLHSAYKGDQILMSGHTDDFSTFWCSGYIVTPWDYASVYLTKNTPVLDNSKRTVTKIMITNSMMGRNSYDQRGAYLLKDSEIVFSACREVATNISVYVAVIKGENKWDEWADNQYSIQSFSYDSLSYIDVNAVCTKGATKPMINFKVTEENFYHIVISRVKEKDSQLPVYISYNITLTRTAYAFETLRSCNYTIDNHQCSFHLKHDSPEQIIMTAEEDDRLGGEIHYQHECEPNSLVFFSVFGVSPLILVVIAIIYVYCVVTRYNKRLHVPIP